MGNLQSAHVAEVFTCRLVGFQNDLYTASSKSCQRDGIVAPANGKLQNPQALLFGEVLVCQRSGGYLGTLL